MTKNDWRNEIRRRIAAMDREARSRESATIVKKLQTLIKSRQWQTVLIYAPLNDEPDILSLTTHSKIRWIFPRVESQSSLGLYLVDDPAKLARGKWGIHEPDPTRCSAIHPTDVDAIVVPGVAMDPEIGARLGRGGGFYDRLLANNKIRAELVGVCFQCQRVSGLPEEPHDVRLHAVLSP